MLHTILGLETSTVIAGSAWWLGFVYIISFFPLKVALFFPLLLLYLNINTVRLFQIETTT
jgi:hypothetical protein